MKFLFSSLLIISFSSQASLVTVRYVGENFPAAMSVRKIFQENYDVPVSLVKVERYNKCNNVGELDGGIHLCIENNGQLLFTGANNFELAKKSILSFTEKSGDNYVN